MKYRNGLHIKALVLSAILGASPFAAAEDIDIFTGKSGGTAAQPRILIVLDNSANWSANDQAFPDGKMGEAEVNAIKAAVPKLGKDVQIGVMEFATNGTKAENYGFVRVAVRPIGPLHMRSASVSNIDYLNAQMTMIHGDINGPLEKTATGYAYGNLMYSAHQYFAGATAHASGAVEPVRADEAGYSTNYSKFLSPLEKGETCGKNYIIFIGNPNEKGPSPDEAANWSALTALNDNIAPTKLMMPGSIVTTFKDVNTTVGTTAACYTDATAANAGLSAFSTQCATQYFTKGCSIGSAAAPAAQACPTGQLSYTVMQKTFVPASGSTPVVGAAVLTSLPSNSTYAAKADVPSSDKGAHACPSTTATTLPDGSTDTKTWACTYSVANAVEDNTPVLTSASTTTCYKGVGTAAGYWSATGTDKATVGTCPTGSVCTWSGVTGATCSGNKFKIVVTRSAIKLVKYNITQSAVPTTTNSKTIPAHYDEVVLGRTAGCYATAQSVTDDFKSQCTGSGISCTYNNEPTSTAGSFCAAGKAQYLVVGTNEEETVEFGTGTSTGGERYADEWARMMYAKGVKMDGHVDGDLRPSVTTYTIDVYNKKPSSDHSSLLMSMAKAGGGKYFVAKNQNAIINALTQVFAEIQAVNSSFASTSLPVSATNRSQNANQVFIGMFRPDKDANPRWFGNLKRYKLITGGGGSIDLGDKNGLAAVNYETGFVTPCAQSYWTTDSTVLKSDGSGNNFYWENKGILPDPAGTCENFFPYSDLPDGPMVEKGAAAQVMRQGNIKNGAASLKDVNRTMLTSVSNGAFVPFTVGAFPAPLPTGFGIDTVRFIRGEDTQNDKGAGETSTTRMSIHGDVIHSRPLPINYSFTADNDVTVFYGTNDGTFRAVDADSGVEKWSFVAEEFLGKLERLRLNTGKVTYAGGSGVGTTPKDYFFDGSTGVYQNADNSKVWIYPTLRRGGRHIYAIDVKGNNSSPTYMWKQGCYGSVCTTGYSGMGQTWSTPIATFIKGYQGGTTPVLIVGGGYDGGYDASGKPMCEDTDSKTPALCTGVGNKVYIMRADTGALINSITTDRSVTGDIALSDLDNDGKTDYAYAVTLGGSIYRINFIDNPLDKNPLDITTTMPSRRVAATNISSDQGRKFLFAPAIFTSKSVIYVAVASGDREHPLAANYPFPDAAAGRAGVTNRMYVYMDDLTVTTGTQDLDSTATGMRDYTVDTGCTAEKVTSTSSHKGWFMNMEKVGEQGVTSALISGGMVTFSTNRPLTDTEGSCATSLGEARGYWVNLLNASGAIGVSGICGGTRSSVFAGGGLPPSPVLASSVKVDGKYVSVVIGAVKKGAVGSGGGGGGNCIICTERRDPEVSRKRKRTYTYTSGD